MSNAWFRRAGLIYYPISTVGWLLTISTGFVAMRTFLMVDRGSHSASDTLFGAGPIIVLLATMLWLLASRSCDRQGR